MSRLCVITARASAYYALVNKLKQAGLSFSSVTPDAAWGECDLVLTTSAEASRFGDKVLSLEDLDENPGVFKGQVLAKLNGGKDAILVGIDPGKRIGLAVFYGGTKLAFSTFHSVGTVSSRVVRFAEAVPKSGFSVRIGNGDSSTVESLVEALRGALPTAVVEVVDESGTSTRTSKMKGLQGDERAAAKIAFRRGRVVIDGRTRTHA